MAQEAAPRIDEHFDAIRANLIRCEECHENFFFDFLRHPRYFVTHFKVCHLKHVLYRVNGCTEEENQRVRFGPRRKKDALAWFSQLKSTEKRMISMQDNKWGEIAERECWSCRLCKQTRKGSEGPHVFEPNELGRRQALLHLRQYHESAYTAFLQMLPAVDPSSRSQSRVASEQVESSPAGSGPTTLLQQVRHSVEAERSRLRRKNATPEAKKAEAERSKRRREQLTPAQRQVDAERRARKRQRTEERVTSRLRRAQAPPAVREREMQRSRARRQQATDHQRQREAQRSRRRRLNATDEQRARERERGRRRYEAQKQHKRGLQPMGGGDTHQGLVPPLVPVANAPVANAPVANAPVASSGSRDMSVRVLPADLAQRTQQLAQQQAGLGRQIRSLCASLALPSSHMEL